MSDEDEKRKVTRDIVEGRYPEPKTVIVGENKGSLFIRLPAAFVNSFNIKKGDRMHFDIFRRDGKPDFKMTPL